MNWFGMLVGSCQKIVKVSFSLMTEPAGLWSDVRNTAEFSLAGVCSRYMPAQTSFLPRADNNQNILWQDYLKTTHDSTQNRHTGNISQSDTKDSRSKPVLFP